MVDTLSYGSQGPRFDFRWRGNSAHDGMAFHCIEPFIIILPSYKGESISSQPIPFPIDRDGHDFHALFQYMFYTWVHVSTHSLIS